MRPISVPEQCCKVVNESHWPLLQGKESYLRRMPGREDSDAFCYLLDKQNDRFVIQTSYYVGVDWVTDNLAVQVRPKVEGETDYIDYLKMLIDALREPENAKHLDGLLTIDFDAKPIPLEEKEDMLSPFLVAQFLMTLKSAVRRGLRYSYYRVSENLKSKVKGRILLGKTVSLNHCKGNVVDNYCDYQEYGINSEENKVLKKALSVANQLISLYRGGLDVTSLKRTIAQIYPYFRGVGDDYDISRIGTFKATPIYKDYFKALEYGILILKRHSYGFNRDSKHKDSTPPYWIDMSKLFELYIYRELRRLYPTREEVIYHPHFRRLEPDYLLKPNGGTPMVIDAKYKPRYHTSAPDLDDLRQISAYARMTGVYKKLQVEEDRIIDCLIVYAHQECEDHIPAIFDELPLIPVDGYSKFYKWGISLPVRE